MMKFFLALQKQARADAKKETPKGSSDYVDPLLFWKKNEEAFLSLSKALLGIPATSAFVERFFTKTGYIMRPHRRLMADKLAEDLFFCKENLSLVDR